MASAGVHDPVDVLTRIQTHIRRHAGDKNVGREPQPTHGDALPFQVTDAAHALGAEELEAADVNPA